MSVETESSPLNGRASYRQASQDVYRSKSTPAADAILAEARAKLSAGALRKQVQKDLVSKGAAPGWAPRVVANASDAIWKDRLAALDSELAASDSDPMSGAEGIRLVKSLQQDDARTSVVTARLRALGASQRVIDFLLSKEDVKSNQRDLGKLGILAGVGMLVAAAFFIVLGVRSNDQDDLRGGVICALVGLTVMGTGLAARRGE